MEKSRGSWEKSDLAQPVAYADQVAGVKKESGGPGGSGTIYHFQWVSLANLSKAHHWSKKGKMAIG
jgi:hypothetical protein